MRTFYIFYILALPYIINVFKTEPDTRQYKLYIEFQEAGTKRGEEEEGGRESRLMSTLLCRLDKLVS